MTSHPRCVTTRLRSRRDRIALWWDHVKTGSHRGIASWSNRDCVALRSDRECVASRSDRDCRDHDQIVVAFTNDHCGERDDTCNLLDLGIKL